MSKEPTDRETFAELYRRLVGRSLGFDRLRLPNGRTIAATALRPYREHADGM